MWTPWKSYLKILILFKKKLKKERLHHVFSGEVLKTMFFSLGWSKNKFPLM